MSDGGVSARASLPRLGNAARTIPRWSCLRRCRDRVGNRSGPGPAHRFESPDERIRREIAVSPTPRTTSVPRVRSARLCRRLLETWDPMFAETIDPTRNRRMEVVLELLGAQFRGDFTVLELGTGPGPLAVQMLVRFPGCRVVALDTDPVLLRVGGAALGRYRPRIGWVLADLREPRWPSKLPTDRFDAVVSSLALHWLEEEEIHAVYRELGGLLRPNGLLVNADYLPSRRTELTSRGQRESQRDHRRAGRTGGDLRSFKAKWRTWWGALEKDPSMRTAFVERQIRMPGTIPPRRTTGPRVAVSVESHKRALKEAGFRESAIVWQNGEMRALRGLR